MHETENPNSNKQVSFTIKQAYYLTYFGIVCAFRIFNIFNKCVHFTQIVLILSALEVRPHFLLRFWQLLTHISFRRPGNLPNLTPQIFFSFFEINNNNEILHACSKNNE